MVFLSVHVVLIVHQTCERRLFSCLLFACKTLCRQKNAKMLVQDRSQYVFTHKAMLKTYFTLVNLHQYLSNINFIHSENQFYDKLLYKIISKKRYFLFGMIHACTHLDTQQQNVNAFMFVYCTYVLQHAYRTTQTLSIASISTTQYCMCTTYIIITVINVAVYVGNAAMTNITHFVTYLQEKKDQSQAKMCSHMNGFITFFWSENIWET